VLGIATPAMQRRRCAEWRAERGDFAEEEKGFSSSFGHDSMGIWEWRRQPVVAAVWLESWAQHGPIGIGVVGILKPAGTVAMGRAQFSLQN
jgi:hypothetical protein